MPNSTPVMTSDRMYGAKNSIRYTARPRSFWLSSTAMASANGSWRTTESPMSSAPRDKSPRNTGSLRSRV